MCYQLTFPTVYSSSDFTFLNIYEAFQYVPEIHRTTGNAFKMGIFKLSNFILITSKFIENFNGGAEYRKNTGYSKATQF